MQLIDLSDIIDILICQNEGKASPKLQKPIFVQKIKQKQEKQKDEKNEEEQKEQKEQKEKAPQQMEMQEQQQSEPGIYRQHVPDLIEQLKQEEENEFPQITKAEKLEAQKILQQMKERLQKQKKENTPPGRNQGV